MAEITGIPCVEARECITTALVQLTATKPLSSITVTELCKVAGVSRMAFYRNFSSKEDVLREKLSDLVRDYRLMAKPMLHAGELWYGKGCLTLCFSFFEENSAFIKSLFKCGFTWLFVNTLADFIVTTWGDESCKEDYCLTAFAGFLCACYAPWADSGFRETPLEMAELVHRHYAAVPSMAALAVS